MKVLCKLSEPYIFTENKLYEIANKVFIDDEWLLEVKDDKNRFIWIVDDINMTPLQRKRLTKDNRYLFTESFYTNKELRKLKLNQIRLKNDYENR